MIVLNKRANIKWIGNIRLMPGSNEVPDAEWATAKANHQKIAVWLKPCPKYPEGELVEVGGNTITDLKPSAAAKLVFETFDKDLLDKWFAEEKRPRVLEAFEAQFAEIEKRRKESEEKARAKAAAVAGA